MTQGEGLIGLLYALKWLFVRLWWLWVITGLGLAFFWLITKYIGGKFGLFGHGGHGWGGGGET